MVRYSTARTTSPMIMFIRRSNRSATAPASGPRISAGSSDVSQTPPTARTVLRARPGQRGRERRERHQAQPIPQAGQRRRDPQPPERPDGQHAAAPAGRRGSEVHWRQGIGQRGSPAGLQAANVRQVRATRAAGRWPGTALSLRSSGAAASPGLPPAVAPLPRRGSTGRWRRPVRVFRPPEACRRGAGGGPRARPAARGPLGVTDSTASPLRSEALVSPSVTYGPEAALLDHDGPAAGRVVTQFTQRRRGGRPAPAAGLGLREQLLRLVQGDGEHLLFRLQRTAVACPS